MYTTYGGARTITNTGNRNKTERGKRHKVRGFGEEWGPARIKPYPAARMLREGNRGRMHALGNPIGWLHPITETY